MGKKSKSLGRHDEAATPLELCAKCGKKVIGAFVDHSPNPRISTLGSLCKDCV